MIASGQDGCLVQHVAEIGAREARGLLGQNPEIDGLKQRLALGVDAQDGLASAHVWRVQHHLPVEPAGTEKRGIEYVGAVGGRHDDDVGVAVEAVHLNQDLVKRLLALFMGAARS